MSIETHSFFACRKEAGKHLPASYYNKIKKLDLSFVAVSPDMKLICLCDQLITEIRTTRQVNETELRNLVQGTELFNRKLNQ